MTARGDYSMLESVEKVQQKAKEAEVESDLQTNAETATHSQTRFHSLKKNCAQLVWTSNGRNIAILRSSEEIKREIKSMLASLMQMLNGPVGTADQPDGVSHPVANVDSLANIGGSSLKTKTKRLMAEVLDNQLAVEFKWTGRGKMGFQALKQCSVIQKKCV
ncbi:hypothetical protein DPMN_017387 [Dreissena polymorpha]|uniref:DUF4806 domain-containing protein n=1 Tax=Dreissena polymorpha TaxID=45954 RepID=A0A9D4NER5_DREPO|nr:hypothetical protein DPMN_017387 [Dreissena polymorpha]